MIRLIRVLNSRTLQQSYVRCIIDSDHHRHTIEILRFIANGRITQRTAYQLRSSFTIAAMMKRSASTKDGSLSPPPMKRRYESTTTSKTSIRSGLSFYLSTITEQTVASFFTPVSKKEPEQITWRILKDSLLVGKYDPNAVSSALPDTSTNLKRTKIAAFDFVRHQSSFEDPMHPMFLRGLD